MVTDEEAKVLILQKHHDLLAEHLNRYLSAEQRSLALVFENLWDKYYLSEEQLRADWKKSETGLVSFLEQLQYTAK